MNDSKIWARDVIEADKENILSSLEEDTLKREKLLSNFILQLSRAQGPLVISLDAPWGSGKTFFVKQAKMIIEKNGIDDGLWKRISVNWSDEEASHAQDLIPVYCDAWKNDNETDPILFILYSIAENETVRGRVSIPKNVNWKKHLSNAFFFTVKAGLGPLAAEGAQFLKKTKDSWSGPELLMKYENQRKANQDLHATITKFFTAIRESYCQAFGNDKKIAEELERKKIVVFIDELDRCRPDFAVRLLERIKHYANDDHVIFVMSTNLNELQHMIKNVYGNGFDAARYLDRFFDIHMMLPAVQDSVFFRVFGISGQDEVAIALRGIIQWFKMSFRETSRYLKWYRMVGFSENDLSKQEREHGWIFCGKYIFPYMIALKLINPSRYEAFLRADLEECESFTDFITTAIPDRIGEFFPLKDNEDGQDPKKHLAKRIQDALKALWPIDNTWDKDAADSSYRGGALEVRRSYGRDMLDRLNMTAN